MLGDQQTRLVGALGLVCLGAGHSARWAGSRPPPLSEPRQRAQPPHRRQAGATRARAAAKNTSRASGALHVHGSLVGTARAAWALGPRRDCAFGVWPAGAEREKPAHARFETPIHDHASSVPAALSKPKPRAQVPHRRRADEPRAPAGGGEHERLVARARESGGRGVAARLLARRARTRP